jgi:hypothetical protein
MGSGISLNKEQMVIIIKRELDNEYTNTIKSIRNYTDEGYLIYETFDHEVEYSNKIHYLQNELKVLTKNL